MFLLSGHHKIKVIHAKVLLKTALMPNQTAGEAMANGHALKIKTHSSNGSQWENSFIYACICLCVFSLMWIDYHNFSERLESEQRGLEVHEDRWHKTDHTKLPGFTLKKYSWCRSALFQYISSATALLSSATLWTRATLCIFKHSPTSRQYARTCTPATGFNICPESKQNGWDKILTLYFQTKSLGH